MRKNTIIELVHNLILSKIDNNSVVIDATLGNGHDTNFLASRVQHVYGFDVLEQAIESSKERNKAFTNITYIHDSHTNLKNYISQEVNLILYNLGYLPGYDKSYTTNKESTIKSINEGLDIMAPNANMIIVVYIGHDNGKIESEAILELVSNLNKFEFDVMEHKLINKDNFPPYIISIKKK